MIESYLIELSKNYPWLLIPYIMFMSILFFSLIFSVLLSVLIRVLINKDKDYIFKTFVDEAPDIYKPWIKIRIGSFLRNMNLPFIYWRFFNLLYGLTKKEVNTWRLTIKDAMGWKRYIVFRLMVLFNQLVLILGIPILLIIFIDTIL